MEKTMTKKPTNTINEAGRIDEFLGLGKLKQKLADLKQNRELNKNEREADEEVKSLIKNAFTQWRTYLKRTNENPTVDAMMEYLVDSIGLQQDIASNIIQRATGLDSKNPASLKAPIKLKGQQAIIGGSIYTYLKNQSKVNTGFGGYQRPTSPQPAPTPDTSASQTSKSSPVVDTSKISPEIANRINQLQSKGILSALTVKKLQNVFADPEYSRARSLATTYNALRADPDYNKISNDMLKLALHLITGRV